MDAVPAQSKPARRRQGWLSFVMLLAALAAIVWLMIPKTIGDHARNSLLKKLSDHYPDLLITIDEGRYDQNHGLIFAGIVVRDRRLPSATPPLLQIDRLFIETQVNLQKLRAGDIPIDAQRVIVAGAKANVWWDQQNGWSLQSLWPLPKMGPGCPLIVGEDIQVQLCRSSAPGAPSLNLSQLTFSLRQQLENNQVLQREFQVRSSGGFLENLQLAGKLDASGQLKATAHATNVSIDSRVISRLPSCFHEATDKLKGLTLLADVQAHVDAPISQCAERWQAQATIHSGRFTDPRLPKSIEEITANCNITPAGVQVTDGRFKIDQAVCRLAGTMAGLSWPSPLQFRFATENLQLEPSLLQMLPGKANDLNDDLRPSGIVDVAGTIGWQDDRWNIDTEINCHGISINLHRFPYPLEDVHGRVRYRDGVTTTSGISCRAGAARFQSTFQLTRPDSPLEHWIKIASLEPLTIDETLISALTPRGEETTKLETFVRSLAPGGKIRLHSATLGRDVNGDPTKQLDIEVLDGRLRYDGFPYQLYEVRGRLFVDDAGVRLYQFQAQNNGGAGIQCEGNWTVQPQHPRGRLDLTFRGFNLPLDDGLRSALPETARQTWDTLSPSGILERLEVNIVHGPETGPPQLNIIAEQWNDDSSPRREVSVTPTALPYRLDITRGVVKMSGDRITIKDLDGYHGPSRLSAEGQCLRRDDGRWQLDLELLTGSRLRPDNELISALPENIRGGFSKLQLREPVSLRGHTQLILPNPQNPHPIFHWDVSLQLEGNRIGDKGPVHSIRGEIAVEGLASRDEAGAEGTIRIDSMHVSDLQITNIQGPFVIQGTKLMLGASLIPADDAPKAITGNVFDGTVKLHGDLLLTDGKFNVDLQLARANVATLLTELSQSPVASNTMTGIVTGDAHLEGHLGEANLLRGSGDVTLANANLYQLPLIVQVLSQLSLDPDEDAAFTDGTTEFTLDGDLITLSDLKLWGTVVALQGGGTITGHRDLDLSFNSRVSPQSAWSKLVRPLRSQKYTLWTIYVSGNIANPTIERRALDAVGETLERLFPVVERTTSTVDGGRK